MRVLVLTRYERLGSSSRVRFYQYFAHLKAHGVELTSAPFFGDDYIHRLYSHQPIPLTQVVASYVRRMWIVLQSRQYDLLWIEKEILPWLPGWFESLFGGHRLPYVVDYDDAVFHRYDMHRCPVVRTVLGRKIDRVMEQAALVIVGNDYLADRARASGAKRVEYLPSVVDVGEYQLKSDPTRAPFRIGWIGSPVTASYLNEAAEALRILSSEVAVDVTLIGAGDVAVLTDIPTTRLPWDEQRERLIGEMFDVGIMPLVDGPFERGKCGYKLVQYMAGGLPVIASPVGINSQMIDVGVNGYLAKSTEEWLKAFRTLVHDEHLRAEMGKASRQKAEQKYNLRLTAPKLLELLSSVQR